MQADEAFKLLISSIAPKPSTSPDNGLILLIALALTNRGIAAQGSGDLAASKSDLAGAIAWLDRIPDGVAESADRQCLKGIALAQLGKTLAHPGADRPEAAKRFNESVDILTKLVAESPDVTANHLELAVALIARGRLRLDTEQKSDAKKDCEQAKGILETLVKSEPNNPQYLSVQRQCTILLADLFQRTGSDDEAKRLQAIADDLTKQIRSLDPHASSSLRPRQVPRSKVLPDG